jgi:hypothetical protein
MLPSNPALEPFYEPEINVAVSLLPATWFWGLVAVFICYRVAVKLALAIQAWWAQRYRREALARLEIIVHESKPDAVVRAHELLKIVAIYVLGRSRVSSVSEQDWYVFLDTFTPAETFNQELSAHVYALLYQDRAMNPSRVSEYLIACRNWIQTHEVQREPS